MGLAPRSRIVSFLGGARISHRRQGEIGQTAANCGRRESYEGATLVHFLPRACLQTRRGTISRQRRFSATA